MPRLRAAFVDRGLHPILARAYAHGLKRLGHAFAHEIEVEGHVLPKSIKRLARRGCRTRSVASTSATLRRIPDIGSRIGAVFDRVGEFDLGAEFAALLGPAAEMDGDSCRRLREIARSVTERLAPRRGRTVGPTSATHELLLEFLVGTGREAAYTYSPYREAFTDPVTRATAGEFGEPRFDPRPALRRHRQRRGRQELRLEPSK